MIEQNYPSYQTSAWDYSNPPSGSAQPGYMQTDANFSAGQPYHIQQVNF